MNLKKYVTQRALQLVLLTLLECPCNWKFQCAYHSYVCLPKLEKILATVPLEFHRNCVHAARYGIWESLPSSIHGPPSLQGCRLIRAPKTLKKLRRDEIAHVVDFDEYSLMELENVLVDYWRLTVGSRSERQIWEGFATDISFWNRLPKVYNKFSSEHAKILWLLIQCLFHLQ